MVHAEGFEDYKPALLVIDVQNKFLGMTDGLRQSVMERVDVMNSSIDIFRSRGAPIIYMLYDGLEHPDHGITCPDALIDAIRKPEGGDVCLHKTAMNSFHNTCLESVLKRYGCDSVVIIGLVAHLCVASTYYAAFDHDIQPFILEGCIAATDEFNVEHTEAILRCVTLDDVKVMLSRFQID